MDRLNLLDILNAKIKHKQLASFTEDMTNIPKVFHGQIIDGIHESTYGYSNINRAYHELISNSKKALNEIQRKSSLGYLSQYISGEKKLSTDDDLNKLIIGLNGTITNTQFTSLINYSMGIISDISSIRSTYVINENNIIIVTDDEIWFFNFKNNQKKLLFKINEDEELINDRNLITLETFQIVTNKRIIHFRIFFNEFDDEENIRLENILEIDFNKIYNENKLVITDVSRKLFSIKEIISSNIHQLWYTDFIPLTSSLLSINDFNNVLIQNLGFLIGPYGIFEVIQQSTGYFFIKVIDNEKINKSLKYVKDGNEWIIVFNDIGLKTYKIKNDGVQLFNVNIDLVDSDILNNDDNYNWLPETGMIETFKDSNDYVNINGLLEYGFVPDLDDLSTINKRIPGAVIGDIKYAYAKTLSDVDVIVIKDVYQEQGKQIRCLLSSESNGLVRLVQDYDLHEFNGLREVTVLDAVKFENSNNYYMFSIENVGIIKGEVVRDANNLAGINFFNIQKFSEVDNNAVKLFSTDDNIFIYNPETRKFYVSSYASNELLDLEIGNRYKPIHLSRIFKNTIFIVDELNNTVYKTNLKKHYSQNKRNIASEIINIILQKSDSKITELFNQHIKKLHNKDSAMTRLNNFIYNLKQKSQEDSTIFISDSELSYISTGFGLTNVERKTTDKNSPYIYGRLNSKTLNSYIGMKTETRRKVQNSIFYDTVYDLENNEISMNELTYLAYKLSNNILKLEVNVPTTFTYYVNNILGWSRGPNTGSSIKRPNLNNGFLRGRIEDAYTEYQLILNREYFKILRVLSANCQLASASLDIYSDKEFSDITRFGMYDSPILTPLCTTALNDDNTFLIENNQNNEVILNFCIFGGDALTINLILETEK